MQCAAHPNVETVVTCSKCDTPICPRCSVPTPVGLRCRSCAYGGRTPLAMRGTPLTRAIVAGAAVALAGGLLWGWVPGGFGWLIAILTGNFIGDALRWAVPGDRTYRPLLIGLAVACAGLAFFWSGLVTLMSGGIEVYHYHVPLIALLYAVMLNSSHVLGGVLALVVAVYKVR